MQTMKQTTLATAGFAAFSKTTRKEAFLKRIDALVAWQAFTDLIEPHYPRAGNGRPHHSQRGLACWLQSLHRIPPVVQPWLPCGSRR